MRGDRGESRRGVRSNPDEWLDRAPDAIFLTDREDRITYWNPAAADLYGWPRAGAVGRIAHDLLRTRYPNGATFDDVRAALERDGHWSGDLVHDTRSGETVTVSSRWTLRRAARTGTPLEWLHVNRDVTDRRRAEADLRAARAEAEGRAALLAAVNGVALRILTSQTGLEALRDIAEAARGLTGARYAAVGVVRTGASADGGGGVARAGEPSGRLGEFVCAGLTPEQEAAAGPLPAGRGVLGLLLRSDRPVRLDDLAAHPASVGIPPALPPMKTFLGVPIRRGDAVLGGLYLTEKEGGLPFSEADETAVVALGAHAAVAIHNLRMLTRQRSLVRGLINAQEEERRAVAHDLHDGLTQFVMAAYAHLESFSAYRGEHEDPERLSRADAHFDACRRYLKEAVVESRRLVNGLRTLSLDDLGLAGALERLVAEEKAWAGWKDARFVHNIAGERFDRALETAVYRVAQEALANVRKHARAAKVSVRLEREGGEADAAAAATAVTATATAVTATATAVTATATAVTATATAVTATATAVTATATLALEVRDWGVGFAPDAAAAAGENGHVGLHSMAERVELLGGLFTLLSAPAAGATVRAVFPLRPATAAGRTEGRADAPGFGGGGGRTDDERGRKGSTAARKRERARK